MSRIIQIDIPAGVPDAVALALRQINHNFEVLAGETGDKESRAITFGDMEVADLDPQQSVYSAAAPTKAEFDKVVDDLTAYRDRINYLIALLRGETVGG